MISLFYFLVYLLKQGNLPGVDLNDDSLNINQLFLKVYDLKQVQSSKDLCFGNTVDLYSFKKEVFGYHFMDTPNYA